jgi:hypothetical protein
MDEAEQRAVCNQHGTEFLPPVAGSRVGIAIETLGLQPLNGMRIDPEGGVCGWYLWSGGEPSGADDFYKPMCIEHLADYCPDAIPFLALPRRRAEPSRIGVLIAGSCFLLGPIRGS